MFKKTGYIFIALIFWAQSGWALSCVDPKTVEKEATSVILFRIHKVEKERAASIYRSGTAEIEVLRIYKGKKSLASIKKIPLRVYCDNFWGPDCRILEDENYPFKEGQFWLIYTKDGKTPKPQIGPCTNGLKEIDSTFQLNAFERRNKPLWTNGKIIVID